MKMKRGCALALLLLCLLFAGCESALPPSATDAGELLAAIEASQPALPPARAVLRRDAPTGSCSSLTDPLAAKIYGAPEGATLPVLERLTDSRIRLSAGLCGCEVHILRGSYGEDTEPLLRLCEARLELLQKRELHLFLGEDYETYVASGRTYVKDGWVFLLLVPDPATAITAIDEVL